MKKQNLNKSKNKKKKKSKKKKKNLRNQNRKKMKNKLQSLIKKIQSKNLQSPKLNKSQKYNWITKHHKAHHYAPLDPMKSVAIF